MANERQNAEPSQAPVPSVPPLSAMQRARRVIVIVLIIVGIVVAAHFLRHPVRIENRPSDAGAEAGADPFGKTPARAAPVSEEDRRQGTADLRRMMAGILMSAADEDGPFQDPENQTPEARRQFLADHFGLPHDYPRSAAPTDVVPPQAQVLVVFENPMGNGARMVFLRMPVDVQQAMAAVHKQYTSAGWEVPENLDPQTQPDQGWLMRFTRDHRDRFVYVRARASGGETLLAVYDSPR